MWFERRPEKTCQKKTPVGKNVQEIWVGTKAQAPSSKLQAPSPSYEGFTKMKLEQPILPDWMHGT